MKDIDFFELFAGLTLFVIVALPLATPIIGIILDSKSKNDYINQLEQNNIEQTEEKEVYRNRCKMLEDLMKENGLVVDECECY